MPKFRLDYIWLDGYQPTANIRTKSQMLDADSFDGSLDAVPVWGFDGSSTQQAEGHDCDCILKPARVYRNPLQENGYFVLCEVLTRDGDRHESNYRALIDETAGSEFWFGFEQEYVLMSSNGRPLGFPDAGATPSPRGPTTAPSAHTTSRDGTSSTSISRSASPRMSASPGSTPRSCWGSGSFSASARARRGQRTTW